MLITNIIRIHFLLLPSYLSAYLFSAKFMTYLKNIVYRVYLAKSAGAGTIFVFHTNRHEISVTCFSFRNILKQDGMKIEAATLYDMT